MRLRWFGQSAFLLDGRVLIDPFGELPGRRFYTPVHDVACEALLITHEHVDHNHAAAATGEPFTVRSRAGTFPETPIGEIVSVASEHDPVAGTQRGANTLIRFTLGGLRVAHLGDLGQAALRPEQIAALGAVDLLFVPVGGGPTIGAEGAHAAAQALGARWVVPMHYRTPAIDFLGPADAFLDGCDRVTLWDAPEGDVEAAPPGAIVPAAP